ncbi:MULTISPECIES: hypothetical protein [unclassified Streptomyces]|uniref:hypothetical protein n=1 Tax=unclassified Streptomyces TaxID=2593676 RepID=UPI00081DCBEA|nr:MULTISPECIES: hypothetical protein [unclassified Streptomyces]MYR29850.1 hypothetical protein [Streptomyces sp. SID4945]SCF47871.1 hypothetical protein GA0115257_11942 [Streptomyces sp. LcepLS]
MAIPGNLLSAATESMDPSPTAGWRPRQNSTISTGAGGRNGPNCLLMRSSAAGAMSVETISAYPVTAGQTYQVFADAAGADQPERIGIEWLDDTYTPVGSMTWALTTSAASSSWHRIGVAGSAPAGATRARVVVQSTTTAANRVQYVENVYFGAPIRTPGNLLPFATESSEVAVGDWTVLANATLSRQVLPLSWGVDTYTAGGHVLAVTATAAGNAAVLATGGPRVTPGQEYVAYAYLQPPTVASSCWIELRTFDASGNQISADRSTLAAPASTGMYRQRASAVALPNAATASVAVGMDGAAAGQVMRVETVVLTPAPPLAPGSVLPYKDASFEQGVGDWTRVSGAATIARSTPWGTAGLEGSYSLAVASASAGTTVIRSGRRAVSAVAGENWRASVSASPGAGTFDAVVARARWWDASGADLGTTGTTQWSIPGAGWWALQSDGAVPAGAVEGAVEVVLPAVTPGATLYLDRAALRAVLPLTELTSHADDGYVTLVFRELAVGQLMSIYRITPDGQRAAVRGPAGLIVEQPITQVTVTLEDHEAPLGVPVYYRLEVRDPSSTVAATRSTGTVEIDLDRQLCWLKDPGNPQRNLALMVQRAPDWERPVDQAVYRVAGRRNAVVLSGVRGGLEGDLSIWTRSDEERAALHLLLDPGSTLLWQAMPGMGVSDMYVQVGQVTEARTGGAAQEPWRAWTLPLTEADQPVTVGVGSAVAWTWADVIAEFATAADVLRTFATAEALLLNRR